MTGVLPRRGETQRHTRENVVTEAYSDAAAGWQVPMVDGHHQKLRKGKKVSTQILRGSIAPWTPLI